MKGIVKIIKKMILKIDLSVYLSKYLLTELEGATRKLPKDDKEVIFISLMPLIFMNVEILIENLKESQKDSTKLKDMMERYI